MAMTHHFRRKRMAAYVAAWQVRLQWVQCDGGWEEEEKLLFPAIAPLDRAVSVVARNQIPGLSWFVIKSYRSESAFCLGGLTRGPGTDRAGCVALWRIARCCRCRRVGTSS